MHVLQPSWLENVFDEFRCNIGRVLSEKSLSTSYSRVCEISYIECVIFLSFLLITTSSLNYLFSWALFCWSSEADWLVGRVVKHCQHSPMSSRCQFWSMCKREGEIRTDFRTIQNFEFRAFEQDVLKHVKFIMLFDSKCAGSLTFIFVWAQQWNFTLYELIFWVGHSQIHSILENWGDNKNSILVSCTISSNIC